MIRRLRLGGALEALRLRSWAPRAGITPAGYDPGRERRAELRARALLRSCVEEPDWAMYRDLGFLRVRGSPQDCDQCIAKCEAHVPAFRR